LLLVLPAEKLIPGANLGPRGQVGGGEEPAHVKADLGDDDGGRGRSDPGDLIEPGDRLTEKVMVIEGAQPQARERFLQLAQLAPQRGPGQPPGDACPRLAAGPRAGLAEFRLSSSGE
jgi:hypothetical protein